MPMTAEKIMFEIYREAGFNRRYRVVWFTELDENNKTHEINAAMAGDHVYDGFVTATTRDAAGEAMDALLGRLNNGEELSEGQIDEALRPYAPA